MASPLAQTSGSDDGHAINSSNTVWSTGRNASTGTNNTTSTPWAMGCTKEGTNYRIVRSMFPFDTSSLTSAATVTQVDFALTTGTLNGGVTGAPRVCTTSVTSWASGSYAIANWGTSSLGTLCDADSAATTTYTASNITFTINKTGTTYVGVRGSADLSNSAPAAGYNSTNWRMSEDTTPSYRPLLTVTYTGGASTCPISLYRAGSGIGVGIN